MYRTRTQPRTPRTRLLACLVLALTADLAHGQSESTTDPRDDTAVVIDMRAAAAVPPPPVDSEVVSEYRRAIEQAEHQLGPYAATLPEQLLGLGTALQQQDRHEEAIDAFKRGVHLARINGGLYSGDQIALLKAAIRSYRALGDYQKVDDRQRYLYRVERRALINNEASIAALIRQAEWQRDAFLIGVGEKEEQPARLMIMWDLYRMALTEMMNFYGKEAPELRQPLTGMLQTQYLVAGHRGFDQYSAANSNEVRIIGLTGEAYRQGESVLNAMLELNIKNKAPISQHVRDTVALGDWSWWFGKEREAEVHYARAMELLEDSLDAEGLHDELFGLPTPLPSFDGIAGLPEPEWNDSGDLVVSFTISASGRVTDLERLREPDVEQERGVNRLVRALRDTRFRPRFSDGMPVETPDIVWSFSVDDWQEPALTVAQR